MARENPEIGRAQGVGRWTAAPLVRAEPLPFGGAALGATAPQKAVALALVAAVVAGLTVAPDARSGC